MPMTTQPYQATEERKHLTTGGPGKEQGTNKLPATRILQRSTRGQQEMGDCSPEVLATSSEQQRPRCRGGGSQALRIIVNGKLSCWCSFHGKSDSRLTNRLAHFNKSMLPEQLDNRALIA